MTTASNGVAVIATQVAKTDRRALSEAWYSALHLSRNAVPVRSRAVHGAAAPSAYVAGKRDSAPPAAGRLALTAPPVRMPGAASARGLLPNERRRPATETARRIERAVATLAAMPTVPAMHTVDVAGGRVRLLVHSDGRTTRIVALCSGGLREAVERALASARFALAGAGLAVHAP
jgi:hypothetical protein